MSSPESTPPTGPSSARISAPTLCVLGLIAVATSFTLFVVAQRFWIDDSFISFRYARNLVEGQGLVYNVGDRVEGYTNFLWTLFAALGLALHIEPIYFAQGISLVAQAGTIWALYQIGRAAGHRGMLPVLAPLFLVGSIAFLAYPMTGMETSFFTLLVTTAFLLMYRQQQGTRRVGIALGLVFLALALTRFDGFVPVILLVSYPILFGGQKGARRALLWPLGVFLIGLLGYNLWRFSFYPTLLPNTFHAKTHFTLARFFGVGLSHIGGFARGWGVVPLLFGLLPFVLRRASPMARHLGWVVLGQAGYVAVVGGDWMPYFRFLLPVLPLFYALMQEGWILVAEPLAERVPNPRFSAVAVVAGLFCLHLVPLWNGLGFTVEVAPFFDPRDARRIGEFLANHLPPDDLIATEWGGIMPYYTHHRTLDTWGLTDRETVRGDRPKTIWGTRFGPRYLAQRQPDLIATNARIMSSKQAAMWSVGPQGNNNYSYYPSMATPELGYEWKAFQLGPRAWWPALVRRGEQSAGQGSDQ